LLINDAKGLLQQYRPWSIEEHAEGFIIRDAKRPSAVPAMPPASRLAR
jgi:hypothetical protein